MITIAQPASPLLYLLNTLMGALRARRWFQKDAERFLEHLLDINASRVQGDAEQRVVDSRLRLSIAAQLPFLSGGGTFGGRGLSPLHRAFVPSSGTKSSGT